MCLCRLRHAIASARQLQGWTELVAACPGRLPASETMEDAHASGPVRRAPLHEGKLVGHYTPQRGRDRRRSAVADCVWARVRSCMGATDVDGSRGGHRLQVTDDKGIRRALNQSRVLDTASGTCCDTSLLTGGREEPPDDYHRFPGPCL